ncbi:MAG: LamG domain-containing protein, partial [Planctomycetota bacterium]
MCKKLFLLVCFVLLMGLSGNAWALVYLNQDIGNAAIPGSASHVGDQWMVAGSGQDIWGNEDGFHYVFRPLRGDGVLEVNLQSMDVTDSWAKVGVMVRETLSGGSRHGSMLMTGVNGVQMVWRDSTGGGSGGAGTGGEVPPEKLRITRSGNQLTGEYYYVLPFIQQWVIQSSVAVPMDEDVVYIGLAVCSHNNGVLCNAVFTNLPDANWPAFYEAWMPSPSNGAGGVPLSGTTLSWQPGDGATSHDVYFGAADPPPLASPGQAGTTYVTGPLAPGTTYNWRIDEVGAGGTVTGDTWSFTSYSPPWGIGIEIWEGIGGTAVSDLTGNPAYPDSPSQTFSIPSMDFAAAMGTDNWMDNYGGRMQGLLWPEFDGDYTFWVAGDDQTYVYLSSDDSPDNLSVDPICLVSGWSGVREYWREAENQVSDPITLVGEQQYFMRVLWKEGGGGDHFSVAWAGPGIPVEPDGYTEISGYYFPTQKVSLIGPADGSAWALREIQHVNPPLEWSQMRGPTGYNVYFGPDPGSMALIHAAIPETSCPLPAVGVGTHFWRVDGVNGGQTWTGDVWSFSVEDPWATAEIGGSWGGGSSYDEPSDTWTIQGDGGDIWGNSDSYTYVYQMPVLTRGDCTLTAKVNSLADTDYWAKAGLMVRESRAPNSKHVHMAATNNLNSLQWRSDTGGGSSNSDDWSGVKIPCYIKLVREGDLFIGYRSTNGTDWDVTGTVVMAMPDEVLVGMAVTSHNWGAVTTAEFEGVSITTPDPRKSWGPDPEDGADGVPIDPVLSWGEGSDVFLHVVYFGTDEDAVAGGDPSAYKGMRTDPSYDPGILNLSETYYFCVDELWNDGRDFGVTLGDVWSFTISDIRPVEDFEPYSVLPQDPPAQSLIEAAICPPAQSEEVPGDVVISVAPPTQVLMPPEEIDDGAQIVDDLERGLVLALDSDGDYVDCGNPAALNFGTGNWSLSVWAKNTMTGTGDANKGALIANGGDGGGGHRYCLIQSENDEGRVTLVTDDNVDKRQARGGTAINDDVWHHVLGVRDGNMIHIYVDGVEDGNDTLPDGYDLSGTSQRPVLVGAIYNHGGGYTYKDYGGLLDDAMIYDYALTADNALFLAGMGGTAPASAAIAQWEFESNFDDTSGSGFHGTPMGYLEKPAYYSPLLVHYAFEGNADDSSGNDLHGTEDAGDGSLPTYEAGMVGQAIRFRDDGDHVRRADTGMYLNGLSELTVSAWVKSEATDRDEGWVHFGTNWSDRRSMRYDRRGGSSRTLKDVIKYGVATTTGNEEDESSGDVQTTEWQHVAMTWSGTGIKLYINGVLDVPGWDDRAEGGVLQGYSRLLVGKGSKDNSGNESWNGLVDDVRIYETALSYGEVRYLAGQMDPLPVPASYGPLIAEYTFDSDASDSSGNDYHGTLMGDATVAGGALWLDGDGDGVNLGHHAAFNPGTGPFSVSAWINMSSYGNNWGNVIISKRGENRRGWQLRRLSNTQRISFTTRNCGDQDGWGSGGQNIELGIWHHVVAVRDGTQKCLYIDGQKEAIADICENIEWSGHNTYIGARATGDNRGVDSWFNGVIDDLRIYNTALSEDEVNCLLRGDTYGPLLLKLDFDGDASDSSGNEVQTHVVGDLGYAAGYLGQAIDLGGDGDFVSVKPVGISGNMPRTITCWAKAHSTTMDDWSLIFGFTTPGGGCDSHFNIGSLNADRVGAHTWCWEQTIFSDEEALEWRHYVMTYDGGTVKYYGDGMMKGSAGRNLVHADVVQIGKRTTHDNSFHGLVDDARIYNYELTWPEIMAVMGVVPENPLADTWVDEGEVMSELEWQSPYNGALSLKVDVAGEGKVTAPSPWENWTLGEAKSWVMYFKGDPGNELEDMYVMLKSNRPSGQDVKLSYQGDMSDLKIPFWQVWNISLDELAGSS